MKKRVANWGNYPVVETEEKTFSFTHQLSNALSQNDSIIARGNGRCYGDASLAPHTISTLKYDKILSFNIEQGIFECQSGITLDQVLDVIVPKGWFLPVTPGTKFITVGGAVASDVHGKNHHVDGSFSAHVTLWWSTPMGRRGCMPLSIRSTPRKSSRFQTDMMRLPPSIEDPA